MAAAVEPAETNTSQRADRRAGLDDSTVISGNLPSTLYLIIGESGALLR
jgi:hypothetical protein